MGSEAALSLNAAERQLFGPLVRQRTVRKRPQSWLSEVIHVRLACPAGATHCVDQDPVPPGDGCGEELDYWFTEAPKEPSNTPPSPPQALADLPKACRTVLQAKLTHIDAGEAR